MQIFRLVTRLIHDRRANVLPIFALSVIPIFSLIGASVDYSRGNSAKAAMQAALDSTSLMLSKEAAGLSQAQLTEKANAYFNAQFSWPEAHNVTVTPILTTLASGALQLDVAGSAMVDSTFTRVFGNTQIRISTEAQVVWGFRKLELALALDNTGSMASSGKIQALKIAAHNLLTTLQAAARNPGDIKVSIVPFDTTVRLPTSYKNETWFDWSTLDCNGSSWGTGCNGQPQNYWEGCVIDRNQPYDVQDTAPTSASTRYPAYDCASLVPMIPLSSDWTALHNKITSMQASGATNVTIGLAWAWHSLTATAPLNEGASPNTDLEKVIVALTDGENTKNRWWGNGYQHDSRIDDRTRLACTNIKAAGIKIYTIRVIEGNANLLRECATMPSMYYDVQEASQLNAVFTSIAEKLANLRLSK
jgi:Flp pilus assembly protein TadG